ncbi:origin recognition complex subunit 2-domain-containing protein [Globomyces pollinis-pini]|nr:origin recognition complex subunit 2-domain-containing protein [Globomyces pollinis-pini]
MTPQTTRSQLRLRATKNLKRVIAEVNSTDESEEQDETDEDEISNGNALGEVDQVMEINHEHSDNDQDQPVHEQYFNDLQMKKSATSNNTLKFSKLSQQEYFDALKAAPKKHEIQINYLESQYKRMFKQWAFELEQQFSLMFYGFGSKRKLLESFTDSELNNGPIIEVFGFHPNVSLKQIFTGVLSDLFNYKGVQGNLLNQVQNITRLLMENDEFCFVTFLIHNVEGEGLASEPSQQAISILSTCPKIRLVCSCDHINTALLWDQSKLTHLNLAWHDVTTFQPYHTETSFENSLITSQQKDQRLGVRYVLRSLPSNARNIFVLLAKHQLTILKDQKETHSTADHGLTFQQLFSKARTNFLVENQITFKTLLTEFKDHDVFQSGPSSEGDVLFIPMSKDDLEDLLDHIDDL